MNLYGGLGRPAVQETTGIMGRMLSGTNGRLHDAACGPGTYGRRLAYPERTVYGVAISMGMLRT